MLGYLIRRVLAAIPVMGVVALFVFLLLRLTPGDPADAYINPTVPMSPADVAALRTRLGLDLPLPVQYLAWLARALSGDLGFSLQRFGEPVLGLVLSRIGPTLLLMGAALGLAIVVGILAGIAGAVRRNSGTDVSLSVLALVGISSPAFLTALIGVYLFAVKLHWAPAGGMTTPGGAAGPGDVLAHLVLPALLLSIGQAAPIMRYMRASLLEVMSQDYVRTARAKGVRERWVILKHALRNALLPVVTLIGSTIGIAVGGAIFIESVFNWPGMGLLLVKAVESRDYPVIMGATLVIGACVILANLVTDIAYAAIDPRIKVA